LFRRESEPTEARTARPGFAIGWAPALVRRPSQGLAPVSAFGGHQMSGRSARS